MRTFANVWTAVFRTLNAAWFSNANVASSDPPTVHPAASRTRLQVLTAGSVYCRAAAACAAVTSIIPGTCTDEGAKRPPTASPPGSGA